MAASWTMLAALIGSPVWGQQPVRPTGGPVMPPREPVGGARPPAPVVPTVNRTTLSAPGGGRALYYQKPADSMTPMGDSLDVTPVAATAPPSAPVVVPDNTVLGPALPPSSRTAQDDPTIGRPGPIMEEPGTPMPSTSNKQPPKPMTDPAIPPLPDRRYIFEMYDDATLERAVVQSIQKANPTVKTLGDLRFPMLQPTVPAGTPYVSKTASYEPRRATYEAPYVVHRRLHFEEKNSERYGWDLGFIQPFVSTAYFYKDVLLWPNSLASGLEVGFWDTNAGKCMPGSPVPYYLYPPGLTITGMLFEGGIITGTGFILRPVGAAAPFIAP